MKKWLLIILSVLVLLAVGLVATYHALLSKNFLVSKIESSINSRVQIGGIGVSLFSVPAKVVISDVIIAKRDDVVRKGVPYDQRPKLTDGAIRVGKIRFDVSLKELFSKRIKVHELEVVDAHANLLMNEQGKLNLAGLFAKPPGTRTNTAHEEKPSPTGPADGKGLNAKDSSGFVTALDRFDLKHASFDMTIEKTGLQIVGSGLNLDLSDIRVDPNALERVNEAKMQFAGQFEAYSSTQGHLKYGQIGLKGPARVRLFDPATGTLSPDAEINFAIASSSYISSKAPYVQKLWNVTDQLRKLGLNAKPLPDRLTFGGERKLHATYAHNRLDLKQPVSLLLDDWELALDGGTWVDLGKDLHRSSVKLIAGAKASDFVQKHLTQLTNMAPKASRAPLQDEMQKNLFVNGRLTLKVATEGALSDPKVKLETRLPSAEKMVRDYAKSQLLNGLLKRFGK